MDISDLHHVYGQKTYSECEVDDVYVFITPMDGRDEDAEFKSKRFFIDLFIHTQAHETEAVPPKPSPPGTHDKMKEPKTTL